MTETFGERVARLRSERGMKHADLALRIGVTDGAIRHYESGETKQASLKTGLLLARALGVSPWFLAYGREATDVPDNSMPQSDRLERLEAEASENLREIAELRAHVSLLLEKTGLAAPQAAPQKRGKRPKQS